MSETNYYRWPCVQQLLYEYNLNPMHNTKYEEDYRAADDATYRFANWQTDMNVLVKVDPSQM